MTPAHLLIDSHGRVLRDLRVSVTDRCNFRCLYCLPETEAAQNFYRGRWASLPNASPIVHRWQPKSKILTFEEIERTVRIAAGLGIQKVRITGGEPLLRNAIDELVARDTGDYVERALRVAQDGDYRRAVSGRIREASGALYETMGAVREVEDFFTAAVAAAASGSAPVEWG